MIRTYKSWDVFSDKYKIELKNRIPTHFSCMLKRFFSFRKFFLNVKNKRWEKLRNRIWMCYFYFLPRSEVEVIGGSDSNLKFELSRIELRFHLFFETKLISLCYDISFFKEGRLLRIFWTRTWLFIDFLDLSLKNRIFYFIVHHQRDYEIVKEANFFPLKNLVHSI